MNLVRRHIGRGIIGQTLGIIACAILEAPDTIVGSSDLFLRRHFGNQCLISRLYRSVQRLRRVGNQQVFFNLADVELRHLGFEICI